MDAYNILWDVGCEDDALFLPKIIHIPDGMEDLDEISDYLSDVTGFCHDGFCLAKPHED